ncbi:Protein CBG08698 [Caenorhabditis briggsae]|uniref:Protein CBG08698 n=2 Tax=Caenorhabditis briggsae TaxID=6238 RepID=A8X6S5_CAEBR|nr:Protein CBG08698 [Caenorhabditis briggsae]ULT88398.1 hypothetical protein L3Y34_007535 [Caenorhabditis briggsae]CAP28336.1 Protein CBG08698 [Caenorhabditis briggsae]
MHCLLKFVFFLFGTLHAENILIINPIFGYSHVKFISKMADVIADHGHNVTLFQPFHIAMKNLEGLVKNKNIEIINYYPDHYEDLLKSEVQTFPEFWDSRLVNNPFLSSFMISKILTDEFAKTGTQLYLLPLDTPHETVQKVHRMLDTWIGLTMSTENILKT